MNDLGGIFFLFFAGYALVLGFIKICTFISRLLESPEQRAQRKLDNRAKKIAARQFCAANADALNRFQELKNFHKRGIVPKEFVDVAKKELLGATKQEEPEKPKQE